MAVADRTNNTKQVQLFTNNLRLHQHNNEFCDFPISTNNTSIDCHNLVMSSARSYFSHLSDSELAKFCVAYMNDKITINNACRFYNFALDNVDQHKSQRINEFIREHFTALHEIGQLSELSLKNFITIIKHDEINVKNEDVIFSSAVQIIKQQTSVEDINRCLELIRFPQTSGYFLVEVILNHPLMKETSRHKYVSEALLYQIYKTSTPEVKPPRYWEKPGIYYLGTDHCMYHYVSQGRNNRCVKMMDIPAWVDRVSSVTSHRERVVIVGDTSAVLLDMTDNTKVTELPNLPEPIEDAGLVQSDNDVYVVGGYNNYRYHLSSIYHLSLSSHAWQAKKSMPLKLRSPLVVQYQQYIYALGGYDPCLHSSVSQYNIKTDTWKRCGNMPVGCDAEDSGVVVHKDRIKVITVDQCLIYADDTDTWTVKQYNNVGDAIKPHVRRGQICAAVWNNGTYRMMCYNDVDNVWKTENKKVVNSWRTKLFC